MAASSSAADLAMQDAHERLRSVIEEVMAVTQITAFVDFAPAGHVFGIIGFPPNVGLLINRFVGCPAINLDDLVRTPGFELGPVIYPLTVQCTLRRPDYLFTQRRTTTLFN